MTPASSATVLMMLTAVLQSVPATATSVPVVVNDDGAWCWFQDERAIVAGDRLVIGSVACGRFDPARKGDIELTIVDLTTNEIRRVELADQFEADDHDAPALWLRPDGKILAVFAKHGSENRFYYRIGDSTGSQWGPLRTFVPSPSSRITYANLLFLGGEREGCGRLYNFYRGLDGRFKPSVAWSDDYGETWQSGHVVIDVPTRFRHRPYVKYATDGVKTIHFLYTDGHPRDFDNSLYHVFYRDGNLYTSDGRIIRSFREGLHAPWEGTRIFAGSPQHVAWVSDAHLAPSGAPVVVFSVQRNSAGLPSGHPRAGQDHRYHYAIWDGSKWNSYEIAHAGTRLYPGEDDYTGNICIDPQDINVVYISTNADPVTGEPLISRADGQRHWEIFQGTTADGGITWSWKPITMDSSVDNLRPMVPIARRDETLLLWFRGQYRTYRDFDTEVVLLRLPRAAKAD